MTPEIAALVASLLANLLAGLKIWLDFRNRSQDQSASVMAKGWDEVQLRDTAIEALRYALLRASRRENAYSTGCELLLIAMPKRLTPEQREIVGRARALFDAAWLHGGSKGS